MYGGPLGLEAIATIDRAVVLGNKWNGSLLSAGSALDGMLDAVLASRGAVAASATRHGLFTGLPTVLATARRVHQAFLGIETLLTHGKSKLLTAFAARQNLVLKAHFGASLGKELGIRLSRSIEFKHKNQTTCLLTSNCQLL